MHRFFNAGLLAAVSHSIHVLLSRDFGAAAGLPLFISTGADDLVWTRRRSDETYPNSKRARQRRHRQARRRTSLRRRRAQRQGA